MAKCTECQRTDCAGVGELRHFASWADLASHLDEEQILFIVNKWHAAADEYLRLKDQDAARKASHKEYRERQRATYKEAMALLDPDERQALQQYLLEEYLREQASKDTGDRPRGGRKAEAPGAHNGGGPLRFTTVSAGTRVGHGTPAGPAVGLGTAGRLPTAAEERNRRLRAAHLGLVGPAVGPARPPAPDGEGGPL